MHKSFTARAEAPVQVWLYTSKAFKALKADPFPNARAMAEAQDFTGGAGQMVLAQSAAVAAGLCIERDLEVQDVPYDALAMRLETVGQVLSWPPPPRR